MVPKVPAADPSSTVRIDTDVGPLLFPAFDQVMVPWIDHYRTWEPEEAAALRDRVTPGMTCLDIGAHVGYHTLVLARAAGATGRVWAIEADPTNFALLRLNLDQGGASNVQPVCAAAWRHTGRVALSLSHDNSGDHRAGAQASGRHSVDVPCVAIDDLLPAGTTVDVVKSDLQGRDHVAIQGMERTIAGRRPLLLVEFWPQGIREFGDDPAAVISYYRGLGYAASLLGGPDLPTDLPDRELVTAATESQGGFCTLTLTPVPNSGRAELES